MVFSLSVAALVVSALIFGLVNNKPKLERAAWWVFQVAVVAVLYQQGATPLFR